MDRYLKSLIEVDALAHFKMAFISGPRQVGKTTLGKSLLKSQENYFSWDIPSHRKIWSKDPSSWVQNSPNGPILFDEIHKHRQWKNTLKGVYDLMGELRPILVSGSAKLDLYRKGNDSLLGRYIPYRLHPFTLGECDQPPGPETFLDLTDKKSRFTWEDLVNLGGFPEPVLDGSEARAQRWSRLRLDRMAYEDTRDVKHLVHLNSFRTLLDLLPERVGSLLSYNSLREDVQVAYATVRDWVLLAESLYFGFFVRPYSKKIKRSLLAEPKLYLFDILQLPKNSGARIENLTALHLLKSCQFWTDSAQGVFELNFVRDKEKREVDFLIVRDKRPWMLVECKSNEKTVSKNLLYFSEVLRPAYNIQLILDQKFDRSFKLPDKREIRIMGYENFLSRLV